MMCRFLLSVLGLDIYLDVQNMKFLCSLLRPMSSWAFALTPTTTHDSGHREASGRPTTATARHYLTRVPFEKRYECTFLYLA